MFLYPDKIVKNFLGVLDGEFKKRCPNLLGNSLSP